ncbi:hypothetical protein [Chondrinema litorale]|uniref:hypothetical protein n=1 Tax=Chondrinema litorale TaxID=2994555 RepID=UPI0025428A56|nr:hypothetical protein [Chondrinema litorale]UZR94012.1 hypothetical protein OQ292_19405 [Chondrinema litorale]
MKKKISGILVVITCLLSLSSCFGPHNKAKLFPVNEDSKRIYGDKSDPTPMQLKAPYEEDETGEMAERSMAIREKLYPR